MEQLAETQLLNRHLDSTQDFTLGYGNNTLAYFGNDEDEDNLENKKSLGCNFPRKARPFC